MPIDLYYDPLSPPCNTVLMTANHIGVKLNIKKVDTMAEEQMKPEFIKMNPQHTVPTIDDNGFILWESRAIQAYLVSKYSPGNPLYPEDPQERAVVDRVLYFDIGTLYKSVWDYLVPLLFEGKQPEPEKVENFKKSLDLLEGFLSKTPYVAGNHLTLADISLLSSLSYPDVVADYDLTAYPKITAWLKKMKAEISNYVKIIDEPLKQFKKEMSQSNK